MKKAYKLLLVAIICGITPFFALQDTKALSQLRLQGAHAINYNNITFGSYETTAIITDNTSEYINLEMYGFVGPAAIYKTAGVISVAFYEHCTGSLTFTFNDVRQYNYIDVVGDGVGTYGYSQSGGTCTVNFDNCISFQIRLASATRQASPTFTVTDCTVNELKITDKYIGSDGKYVIPIESYLAYLFATLQGDLNYDMSAVYPYYNIVQDDPYTGYSKIVYLKGTQNTVDKGFDFAFLSDQMLSTSDFTNTLSQNVNISLNLISESIGGMFLYRINVYNTLGSTVNVEFTWNKSFKMIPLYAGTRERCPNDLYSMIYGNLFSGIWQITQSIDITLMDIYDLLLNGDPNDTPVDTSVIDDTGSVIDDYTTSEQQLTDFFDDSMSNIDLTDYSLGSSLLATVQWLNTQMTNIFEQSGEFKILFTLPLVLGIALFFIGRGAVVFRQGNIDRAELRQRHDIFFANEYADYVHDAEDDHSRAYRTSEYLFGHSRLVRRSKDK